MIHADVESHLSAEAEREEVQIGRIRVSQEILVNQLDALLSGV
jgi:hypothetical protein